MGGGLGSGGVVDEEEGQTGGAARGGDCSRRSLSENLEDLLKVEPLSVEVGVGLISFLTGGANSQLLKRIGGIRKQLATDLGFIIPPVRVADNLSASGRANMPFDLPEGRGDGALRTAAGDANWRSH